MNKSVLGSMSFTVPVISELLVTMVPLLVVEGEGDQMGRNRLKVRCSRKGTAQVRDHVQ